MSRRKICSIFYLEWLLWRKSFSGLNDLLKDISKTNRVTKLSLRMPVSHVGVGLGHGCSTSDLVLCWWPGKAAEDSLRSWAPLPHGRLRKCCLLVPDFGLAQFRPLWPFGEWISGRNSLSPPLSAKSTLQVKINECFENKFEKYQSKNF